MDITTSSKIEAWDEHVLDELDGGASLARAEVTLGASRAGDDTVSGGMFRSDLAYRADKTGDYTTLMRLEVSLEGRGGSFVALGRGTYADGVAGVRLDVVEGSGTGDLAGVTGSVESSSTAEDYPYMPLVLHLDLP